MFGAPKKCAKCDKQVYPIEELKCLDKIWHKSCFKCSVCNSILNMKNYKGFDKQPYCFAHYPQQKPTVVSENPELLRIKENTKIQSNVKYHEDFEKSKGIYTVVADDPETRRVLENSKIISQAKYHEEFEKNKKRHVQSVENFDNNRININSNNNNNNPKQSPSKHESVYSSNTNHQGLIATFKSGENLNMESKTRKIGLIADYDPLCDENNSNKNSNSMHKQNLSTSSLYQPQLKIQTYNSLSNIPYKNGHSNNHSNEISKQVQNLNSTNGVIYQPNIDIQALNRDIKTTVYRAIYDYDEKEDDEISFRDGDKFINCEQIDVGWMIGVHEKTGKHGMFPANYAEPVDYF